jgi:hypothetical protein
MGTRVKRKMNHVRDGTLVRLQRYAKPKSAYRVLSGKFGHLVTISNTFVHPGACNCSPDNNVEFTAHQLCLFSELPEAL